MGRKRKEIYEQAYLKYQEGYSLSQLSTLMGISKQNIYRGFKIRKFKLRGASFNLPTHKPESQ